MTIRFSKFILLLTLSGLAACTYKPIVSKVSESHVTIDKEAIDSSIYRTIAPYKISYNAQMNKVLAQSEEAFLKTDVESSLGNFFCDAVLFETKKILANDSTLLDAAVFNKGGLRNSLPKGAITLGNIFELMPFDNEIILLKLSGEQFKDMCFKIVEKGGIPIGGMRLTMKGKTPQDIFVKGKPFDITTDYWIVTSDYLANGGDNYTFFKNAIDKKIIHVLLRDVIVNYCKDMNKQGIILKPYIDGRIHVSE